MGSKESACSIAGINLALSGRMTGLVPDCMSNVVGRWIISVQDRMPDAMRNSDAWRKLLPHAACRMPHAAGTGSELEDERLAMILDWMVDVVLVDIQEDADRLGFGEKWAAMISAPRPWAAGAAEAAWAAGAAKAAKAAEDAAWDRYDPAGLLRCQAVMSDRSISPRPRSARLAAEYRSVWTFLPIATSRGISPRWRAQASRSSPSTCSAARKVPSPADESPI